MYVDYFFNYYYDIMKIFNQISNSFLLVINLNLVLVVVFVVLICRSSVQGLNSNMVIYINDT